MPAAVSLSTTDDEISARLASLATGFAWHARVHALTDDSLARARHVTLDGVRKERASPLVPESALVLASRLSRALPKNARVVVIDGSAALADALAGQGHEVTVLVETCEEDAYRSLSITPRAFALRFPLADDLLATADLVVVDAFRREGTLVPLLCRALALAKPQGVVSLLAHALSRDLVKTTLALLPVREHSRDDEIAARLLTGGLLADIFWDHVTLERTDGALPIAPTRSLSVRELSDHDPEGERHGCVEISGLMRPIENGALRRVIARYTEMLGLTLVADTHHQAGVLEHAHAVFSDGVTLVALVDRERGVFRADMTGWTPSLHVDLAAAVVTTLPRDAEPLRFSTTRRAQETAGAR